MTCRRTTDVEPGRWYSIKGNNSSLFDIPPQLFFVRKKGHEGVLGRPYVVGASVMKFEGKVHTSHNVRMFLDTVGVYDTSSGMLGLLRAWRMREHGRYMVKHDTIHEAWKALLHEKEPEIA